MSPALDSELDEIAGYLNAQHARLARVAHQMLATPESWAMPGVLTLEQFLCWRTGISRSTAQRIVTIARRWDELPECVVAFDRGELSLDQMTAVAAKVPAWADHDVAELAPMLTVRQLQRLLGKYDFTGITESDNTEPGITESGDDDAATGVTPVDVDREVEGADLSDEPLGPPVPEHHRPPQPMAATDIGWCRFWFDDDGRFHLQLETDQASGMVIEQSIGEARDHLFNSGRSDVTMPDAVLEIAQRSLDAIDSPDRRNRWRINLHLRTDGRCTDGTGHFLPDAIRHYLTCDGMLTPTFFDNGIPVSVGRSQHIVPDRTRRVVIERDGGCIVPGCHVTHHLEVHHIIHWDDDGPSDTWNLGCLCPHHHRLHHQGRLGISGNADIVGGLTFTDETGRIITASGIKPKPPGGPPPPITGHFQHPLGQRLDMNWVQISPPSHYGHRRAERWRNRASISQP